MAKKKAIKRKAKSKAKPKPKRKKLPLMNFKASGKDRAVILAKAKKHAGGNYSAWVRHASKHYKPKAGEVIR